jgi:hypothetical protein
MTALPLALNAALAIAMVGSVWRGFFGAPPTESDRGTAYLWGATAALLYLAAIIALMHGRAVSSVLFGLGVIALAIAVWHGRGEDDDGGDDGGDGDGPTDWDAFDRARRDWDRPLAGV